MKPNHDEMGVGATEDLRLRVSVATMVRVLFEHPRDGELMLALERRATLYQTDNGRVIEVKSQPFGGGVRIQNLKRMRDLIGDFHFDSERSRDEQDFRIFIRPSDWSAAREFCIEHLNHVDDPVLETDPARELVEEFADALTINLKPEQYVSRPVAIVVEEDPAPTENIHARGYLTARVYRIFEARILDSSLSHAMLSNSRNYSNQKLQELALEDAQKNGKGRASAILTLPMEHIRNLYLAISPEARNTPISFETHKLDETVAAVLEEVPVPKYRRL